MTPNQEPVERELLYGKKLIESPSIYEHGVLHFGKYGDGFIPERLATQKDIDTLSHQKDLSRAEVLEEIRDGIMKIDRCIPNPEPGRRMPFFIRGYIKAIDDTLAVIDEKRFSKEELEHERYLRQLDKDSKEAVKLINLHTQTLGEVSKI